MLLWYWVLRKNSINTRSPSKKNILTFPATVLGTMMHETWKKINLTGPSLKNIYFRFWLLWCTGQFLIGTRPHGTQTHGGWGERGGEGGAREGRGLSDLRGSLFRFFRWEGQIFFYIITKLACKYSQKIKGKDKACSFYNNNILT